MTDPGEIYRERVILGVATSDLEVERWGRLVTITLRSPGVPAFLISVPVEIALQMAETIAAAAQRP